MLNIVKNRKPYEHIVATVSCIEEALCLADKRGKTFANTRGQGHNTVKETGWVYDDMLKRCIPKKEIVHVLDDWILEDAQTGQTINIPESDLERWRLCRAWEDRMRPRHDNFDSRRLKRRRGRKPQARGGQSHYRSWNHNAVAEFDYADEMYVGSIKLKKTAFTHGWSEWDRVSKSWKDQSHRKTQYYRVAEM
jgi:hypothetical protein